MPSARTFQAVDGLCWRGCSEVCQLSLQRGNYLIHLFEWHMLLLNWVNNQRNGVDKLFLPAPYSWKTYSEMNIGFCQKYQDTSSEEAKKLLTESHRKVLRLLDEFMDDELFEKKHFK
jgi:hypothetical protein